jgi:hypothetical protein
MNTGSNIALSIMWVAVSGLIFILGFETGYKKGQVDVLSGVDIAYELVVDEGRKL